MRAEPFIYKGFQPSAVYLKSGVTHTAVVV